MRTLTPTRIRVIEFPRWAALVLPVAMAVGAVAPPAGGQLGRLFWVGALIAGVLACCDIAAWAEQRVYRRFVGLGGFARLGLTLLTPLVFVVAWVAVVIVAAVARFLDNGVLIAAVFSGGTWFLSASLGTIVVVSLDVLISALIIDFRSRIQTAVLGLLAVTLGATWGVFGLGQLAGAAIRRAAMDGALPGDFTIALGDEVFEGQQALDLVASAETERFIALAFVVVAAALGLPAILSACGKLADAVMERLNPLREAMERVGDGDLDVRVEVGGSKDLRQISKGFNTMAESLTTTMSDLDARNRELMETNQATNRFVPFQFLELLNRKTIRSVHRGDQTELNMSVMFCDIRSFTAFAERIGAQATFDFMNRYLSYMEVEIHQEQGFISDFFGDGITALFHTSADAAVRAGLGMLAALRRFNKMLAGEGQTPIRVGIGINSGTLMLGTIGGRERLSCTVIGDVANTAARVEGMTKLYRASLLVSHGTYEQLEDASRYHIREVDCVQAKGKLTAASIYEVLDALPAMERSAKMETHPVFAEALRAYRQGEFEGAKLAFERCLERAPLDGAAALYVQRCARFIKNGPPAGWDGVTRLDSK